MTPESCGMWNDTFLKFLFNFHVLKCSHIAEITDSDESDSTVGNRVLGILDNIFLQTKSFFVYDSSKKELSVPDGCSNWQQVNFEFDVKFSGLLLFVFCLCIVSAFLPIIIYKFKRKKKKVSVNFAPENKPNEENEDIFLHESENKKDSSVKSKQVAKACKSIQFEKNDSNDNEHCYPVSKTSVQTFLQKSVDSLFRQLDEFLLERSRSPENEGNNARQSSSLTSTMTSRRPNRRSTSPSLRAPASIGEIPVWQEFQCSLTRAKNAVFFDNCDNHSSLSEMDNDARHIIQYFKTNSALRFGRWKAACLIIDYVMFVFAKTCKTLDKGNILRFDEFRLTGSILKGIKSCEPDSYDYHAVFSPNGFAFNSIGYESEHGTVPPGKVILKTDKRTLESQQKAFRLVKDGPLEASCLSHEFLRKYAESLLDKTLQKLYTEHRSLVDRLPFRILKLSTGTLTLGLDTRNTAGIHLPEIRVNLIPAIALFVPGSLFNSSIVYAVPPWNDEQDLKRQPETRGHVIPQDVVWSLSFGEFEQDYLFGINTRMKFSGVCSCYRIVLGILKCLFSRSNRRSLLDKGEIIPAVLEQTLFYMWLESSPKLWDMSQVATRFSDSILFLKTALRYRRFPNFFVNNPYVNKEMHILNVFPFLTRGKQENLLFSDEDCDKSLAFMEKRLKECKMDRYIRAEYSEDLWEFEFFIYN